MQFASLKVTFLASAILAMFSTFSGRSDAATVPFNNGSFENGTTGRPTGTVNGTRFSNLLTGGPGWDIYSTVKDWKTKTGSGVEVQSDRNPATLDAQAGDYYVSLDGLSNASIEQKVKLAAGTYILSFWYSPQTTLAATNSIGYNLGNIVSGQVTAGTNGARVGIWTEIRTTFVVLSRNNYDLLFSARGASDGIGGFIDNVTIETVPVPAAGLALLTGLFGLVGMRRRRRA